MPPTPVDEHTEEFEQLAGLSALDVLEGEELVRFKAHATGCERCRLMVRHDREALALAAPEMDPSPDFKARLMERAARELADSVSPAAPAAAHEPTLLKPAEGREATPPNVIPLWRRSPWVSALAAVFVLGLVTAGAFSYENQVVASYALSGNAPGKAMVIVRRSGATELELSGVPNPPPGRVYEAWVIPPDGKPIPVGVTSTGDATLPLNGISNGETIAITEEASRVDAPTSTPVMATVVRL